MFFGFFCVFFFVSVRVSRASASPSLLSEQRPQVLAFHIDAHTKLIPLSMCVCVCVFVVPPYTQVTIAGNSLRFYDTKEKTSRFLWGAGSGISCFAVSQMGRLIAYATKGLNPTIHLHTLGTMERVIALEGVAQAGVSALGFSRDGQFLAVASAVPDLTLTVRMARTGQVLVETALESEAIDIKFSPFNAFEVLVNHAAGAPSGAAGATLHVIDKVYETYSVQTRSINVQTAGVAPAAITAALWSPENTIYLGTDTGAVLVARPATGDIIAPPAALSETIIAELLGADDAAADAADAGEDISSFLPPGANSAWIFTPGQGRGVSAMAFTKDHVMIAGSDGTLRFYTHAAVSSGPAAGQLQRVTPLADGDYEEILGMTFNPIFAEAVVTTAEGGVYVVNIDGDINSSAAAAPSAEASSNETAAGGEQAEVTADPATSSAVVVAEAVIEVVKVGDFHAGAVTGVVPLADGNSVATCGVDGTLRGWDLITGTCAWKRTLSSEQAAMTSSSLASGGSGVIAVASATGVIRVFDAGAGVVAAPHLTLRARLTTDVPDAIAMNEAGTWLAVAGMYGDCWLIEIATAQAARVVGYVALPARACSMVWDNADDGGGGATDRLRTRRSDRHRHPAAAWIHSQVRVGNRAERRSRGVCDGGLRDDVHRRRRSQSNHGYRRRSLPSYVHASRRQ